MARRFEPKGRTVREQTIAGLALNFSKLPDVLSEGGLIVVLRLLEKLRKYLDAARD